MHPTGDSIGEQARQRLTTGWTRLRLEFRQRPQRTIEIGFGILVLSQLLGRGPRTVMYVWFVAGSGTLTSFLSLLSVDRAETVSTAMLAVARMAIAMLPAVVLIASSPRYRMLWLLPIVGLLFMMASPISLAACATPDRWLLLVLVALGAAVLCRVRWMAWTFVLPFLVLAEVVPRHGGHATGTEYRAELLAQCSRRGGGRPGNLTANLISPYHGITRWNDDVVLLSGEGPNDGGMRGNADGRPVGSWWMRRGPDGFEFDVRSKATGNLWRGCILNETIWMGRANNIVGAKRLSGNPPEHVEALRIPADEIDFTETACDPERGRILVAEATAGGLWEIAPDGNQARRHALGGIMLLPKRRFDGKIVVTNSAELMVFDPATGGVVERQPAGLADFGFDVCEDSGTVAVADMSGRMRVFELDPQGRYRFAWGVSLFAPRRIAYSRDCSRIAVTSADDRRVFLVDAASREILDVIEAGPALREVAATGPREFSVADLCSINTYRW